jgi:hypothetical protein
MKVTSLRARASGVRARQRCRNGSLSNNAARKRRQTIMRDVDRAKASIADDAQVFVDKRLARCPARSMPEPVSGLDSLGVARQAQARAIIRGDDGPRASDMRAKSVARRVARVEAQTRGAESQSNFSWARHT